MLSKRQGKKEGGKRKKTLALSFPRVLQLGVVSLK
jgi:hypothetical protein